MKNIDIEKGCPFCGSCMLEISDGFESYLSNDGFWVECENPKCLATGPVGESKKEAIDLWDKRYD